MGQIETSLMMRLMFLLVVSVSAQSSGPWPSGAPHWPHYPSRRVTTLSGTWAFGRAPNGTDPKSLTYEAAVAIAATGSTVVPGAIDIAPPGTLGWRGVSAYHAAVPCSPGASALFRFGAVNFAARIYLDGVFVHEHCGGYSPFDVVTQPCLPGGSFDVLLVVSNLLAADDTYTGGDFYAYSGIIRPVIVTELPAAASWLLRVEPITVDSAAGVIDLRVVVGGDITALGGRVSLSVAFNGGVASVPVSVSVAANGDAVVTNLTLPNAKPWNIGEPNLYTVTVTATATGDAMTARSGLRTLGIDSSARITINGRRVLLTGYNRHTMWPDTGAAVSPAQEAIDISLLRELNANYVRGAHYPQSQSFLDRLDEAGIVIWEESLGPGVSANDIANPGFMEDHLRRVEEMVGASFAHPSVIIHGFFNEGPSNNRSACTGYGAMADRIRSRVVTPGNAPMRFVTWANNHNTTDVCIAHEDIISFNAYPGWYSDADAGNAQAPLAYWPPQVEWVKQNYPTKPFTVSETGGGGLWEWSNATAPAPGPQWSLQYQAALVSNDVTVLLSNDRVSGLTLWQFSDIKANDADTATCGCCIYPHNLTVPWDCGHIPVPLCHRPKGENNKGTVDMWRRKKPVFDVVSALYKKAGTQQPQPEDPRLGE
jgi:beta-glucuronidase